MKDDPAPQVTWYCPACEERRAGARPYLTDTGRRYCLDCWIESYHRVELRPRLVENPVEV